MDQRALLRRAFPYLVIGIGGFALAYVIIFVFVLPSKIVPPKREPYNPDTASVLQPIDTTQWYPTVMRKDYALAFTVTETGLDDPDQMFYENYSCGSERNYTGSCNAEVDKLIDQQSVETDVEKRRRLVWQIEKYLAEDGGRPIIFHPRSVTCSYPQVKGITVGVNSPYNLWRMEDAWLDR